MARAFDIDQIRADFPALDQAVNEYPLVYLDSAATALKPRPVIDRITQFYAMETANVHRGAHHLANEGTTNFEATRKCVANFLGDVEPECVIFTKGTTDSFNLIAESFCSSQMQPGDEVLISDVEHHANIVPWQLAAKKYGVVLKHFETDEFGQISAKTLEQAITDKTKLISVTQASNTLGTIQPIEAIAEVASARNVKLAVDGAQYVAYHRVNLAKLGVDFYTFSAHKIFGPYGVGILYGKKDLLNAMPPYQSGGAMIDQVVLDSGTSFNDLPYKFEAGTPNISGVIATEPAISYFLQFDLEQLESHERAITEYAYQELQKIKGLKIFGPKLTDLEKRVPILSFAIDGIHHADLGALLDQYGVAVRVGHHCTQPLMKKLGVTGTTRASFSIFNHKDDVDRLVSAVKKAQEMLA